MKKLSLTTLSLVALFAAGTAFAVDEKPAAPKDGKPPHEGGEHHGNHHGKMLKEVDTNGDGAIGKDEWQVKGDKMFSEIDANKDGKIAPEEMKTHHEKKREEWKERREERKEKMGDVKAEPVKKETPAAPKH